VVPHACGPEYAPDPELRRRWRSQMGLPAGVFVIGKVGVNTEDDRKAFAVTLQAFAEFHAKHPNTGLYLHTLAQMHPMLKEKGLDLRLMVERLGLRDGVAFADMDRRRADLYTRADMAAMYNGCDVLDAISKGEGFGVPVIESLACGTPVIASRNSALTEKIRPGWGWLTGGQREWARHHSSWWTTPSVPELLAAYEKAFGGARQKRAAAAREGARWTAGAMTQAWQAVLEQEPLDHADVFARVYATGAWGAGSGSGSDPRAAEPYCRFVERYIREHEVTSVLDLGCGDGQIARAIDWGAARYQGADTVPGLGAAITGDIRSCGLPAADLVLVKDVLQHWPNADIEAMRPRLQKYPRVLITNSASGHRINTDIQAGSVRALNLAAPPFRWPVREVFRWQGDEVKSVTEMLPG
jgi:Glycosyl transferases group 1